MKAKHRNNLNDCQASVRLVEAEETKFVSVSCVFGDFSDEKVKRLVFGRYAAKVVLIHYELSKLQRASCCGSQEEDSRIF